MCASQFPGSRYTCSPTYKRSLEDLESLLLTNATAPRATQESMKSLLAEARVIQNDIFQPLLAGSAVLFLFGVGAAAVVTWCAGGRIAKLVRPAAFFLMVYALGLGIAAALSTSQVVGAMHFATTKLAGAQAPIAILGGTAIQGLQWTIVALLFVIQLFLSRIGVSDGGGGSFLPGPGGDGYKSSSDGPGGW